MAFGLEWFGAAMRTVRDGLSARAGLGILRAAGGRTGDAVWFRMVAEARRILGERAEETGRPLNRRPTGDEITVMGTRSRSGYWQQVEVFARDRSTGEIYSSPFVLRGEGLLTRRAAIRFALDEWEAGSAGTPNPNDDEVLGATYVSTLELQPAASPPAPTITQATVTVPTPMAPTAEAHVRATYAMLRGRMGLPEGLATTFPEAAHLQRAMRKGGYVMIADVRDALPDIPRNVLDDMLRRLARSPGVEIIPEAYGWALTNRDRAGALEMGGQPNHWLKIN